MADTISVEDLLALGKEIAGSPEDAKGILYQAEQLLRVRTRDGEERPLAANKAQREFEMARGKRNIILKARQMGMTTWVSGRFFLKTVSARGVLTVQVAHTRESAESIFRIVQRFWECLPAKYREGPLRKSRSNVRQMVFPALDSEFRVLSAADMGCGRGLTIQNLHCSEVSRWPGDAAETLAGLRAALSLSGELVLESTANGAYGCFYNEWTRAHESGMARHFLPWWLEDAYVAAPATTPTDEEKELIDRNGLSLEQIGFRRGLEADYRGLRAQEFAEDPERCFRATGECCFETDVIEERLLEVGDPVDRERHGALCTWAPPMVGKEYLIAVDTAGGGSEGDYSVAQVIDLASGMQCAELQQRLRTLELSQVVKDLATRYHGALVVVERNNHGAGVLAYLESVQQYANVYRQADGLSGWLTTSASKPRIISKLGALLVDQPELFYSKRLLSECRTYVTRSNGSTGAVAGAYDDCLMAMAIAQEVRSERMIKRLR